MAEERGNVAEAMKVEMVFEQEIHLLAGKVLYLLLVFAMAEVLEAALSCSPKSIQCYRDSSVPPAEAEAEEGLLIQRRRPHSGQRNRGRFGSPLAVSA